ncbi:hypothetical protein SPSIL_035430 [Sporomusa silvacetica DSM 10669]|uniref:Spo0E like sporulation regulatory protein n=1 Tax=Sporomusa silvacetica DSM 10669 TaxID=1123289 RepID=A0ABZ3INQ1_9FIRM|nr:hypothetical protein [Sporomusa silvacetica]OZC15865.1 hypothetical protein SPSIL_39890 [Sporomusa silvacetica DSM 10669]
MIEAEVYDRIDTICKLLNRNGALSEHLLYSLYDELEILCNAILESKRNSKPPFTNNHFSKCS